MSGDESSAPAAESPPGGAVFLPAHGLQLEGDRIPCHGLLFMRVDGRTWSSLEAVWMRDQELDEWLSRERVFAVMPFEGELRSGSDHHFARALAAYDEIVAAARLTGAGTWIDGGHLAAVARGDNGINIRLVGTSRPRMWASVFGEPLKVRGRRREWGGRVECRPLQFHLPHGPAFLLDTECAQRIERGIAALAELRQLAPHHAWWAAHRSYQRGHDLFLPRRLRLTALLGGFEALFGSFRREPGDPGLGAAVATLLGHSGWEVQDPAGYVEKNLRRARNRLAHGSDAGAAIDFASVEENLIDLMRIGLGFSSAWIRGIHYADGPIPPGPARTLVEFQRWLGRPTSNAE